MQSILGGTGFPAQCADAATGRLAGILNRTGNCFLKNVMMETLALSALIFCSTDGSSFTFCPPFTLGRPPTGFMGPMKISLSGICGGKVRFGRKYFYSSFIS